MGRALWIAVSVLMGASFASVSHLSAQDTRKTARAVSIDGIVPNVDGFLNDEAWSSANPSST